MGRSATPVRLLTASSISGDKVFNPQGDHLGRIMDVMLNVTQGTVEYIVVEFGGVPGVKSKYFAIPFTKLTIDTEREAFIIDMSRESFEDSPGFDRNHWPEPNSHWPRSWFDGSRSTTPRSEPEH